MATRLDLSGLSYLWDKIVAKFATKAPATTSAAGLMSATDKAKLDGIAAGAQVNSLTGVKGNAESSYRQGNVNLTPANIGAVPTALTTIDDCNDNTLTGSGGQIHFYRTNSSTLNTPYKQGLTSGSESVLFVFGNSNYTTQISYGVSDKVVYIRVKAGSGSTWNGKAWMASVTGVKGDAESTYRHGNVNLTPANLGIIMDTTARTIAEGTSTFTLSGLTADHVVVRWQFSGDYTDNYPPANITVTTSSGSYTITADSLMSSGITMQPIFIKP